MNTKYARVKAKEVPKKNEDVNTLTKKMNNMDLKTRKNKE